MTQEVMVELIEIDPYDNSHYTDLLKYLTKSMDIVAEVGLDVKLFHAEYTEMTAYGRKVFDKLLTFAFVDREKGDKFRISLSSFYNIESSDTIADGLRVKPIHDIQARANSKFYSCVVFTREQLSLLKSSIIMQTGSYLELPPSEAPDMKLDALQPRAFILDPAAPFQAAMDHLCLLYQLGQAAYSSIEENSETGEMTISFQGGEKAINLLNLWKDLSLLDTTAEVEEVFQTETSSTFSVVMDKEQAKQFVSMMLLEKAEVSEQKGEGLAHDEEDRPAEDGHAGAPLNNSTFVVVGLEEHSSYRADNHSSSISSSPPKPSAPPLNEDDGLEPKEHSSSAAAHNNNHSMFASPRPSSPLSEEEDDDGLEPAIFGK